MTLKNNATLGDLTEIQALDHTVKTAGSLRLDNAAPIKWHTSGYGGAVDLGFARAGAGVVKVTDGSTGYGDCQLGKSAVTNGSLTQAYSAYSRQVIHKFTWANTDITGLGASPTGDIAICTLPARTRVVWAGFEVTGAATFADTLVGGIGVTGANYDDFVVDSDLKSTAFYGDTAAERGTSLDDYSFYFTGTSTPTVYMHVDGNLTNLSGVTGSTGTIWIVTETLA